MARKTSRRASGNKGALAKAASGKKKSKDAKGAGSEGESPRSMKTKKYMKELLKLQTKLCHLQEWVKHKGLRAIVIFEGRDGAGKGGTIRAITERVSPRVFRVVALPAP